MPKEKNGGLLELNVRIIKRKFAGDDGYAVYEAELIADGNDDSGGFDISKNDLITIQGNFDRRFFPNEEYYMYGTTFEHKTYGVQYKIQFVETKFDTPDRIRDFLLVYCAESIVNQLIDKYGGAVLDKIVSGEVDYSDIHGMGDYRFNALREKVTENKYMKDMILSLSEYGVTPNQMKRISVLFGANATERIKDNPYILCQVSGIGFLKADSIAERMGYDMQSPNRIDEAIKYVLEEMQSSGNSWMIKKSVASETFDLINVDKKLIMSRFNEIEDLYISEEGKVALRKTYDAERFIAERLLEMLGDPHELTFEVEQFITEMIDKYQMKLTEQQQSLFYNFSKHRVNFLVGYAGCGKSALQVMLLDLADRLNLSTILLAPTGKASKVLEEYTGRKAYTMHRALKVIDFKQDSTIKLWEDLIIVDESSMADVFIIKRLMQAIENPKARILFIGDDFQIPSVGVGNFLHDCIDSEVFPVTKLTKVFRQAEGGLLDAVTKIRLGTKFIPDNFEGEQRFGTDLTMHCVPQQYMEDGYKHWYKMAMRKFEVEDIIVLTPTKKGALGTVAVNNAIQQIVNPTHPRRNEVKHGLYTTFREGDRVMNTRNTYQIPNIYNEEIDIVNGDMGVIESINNELQIMVIDFGFDKVPIHFKSLDAIIHCWAMTIHKSQGSGFKCIIVISDKAHKFQLNANLIYTGWTRAKQYCVFLGQADVLNSSMKKNVSLQRNTFLPELLESLVA